MEDITFIYYRWEVYSVETELMGFDSTSTLLNLPTENKDSESSPSYASSSVMEETIVNDVNSDSVLSSQTQSIDSPSFPLDSPSFPIDGEDWLIDHFFLDNPLQSEVNIAFPTLN